MLDLVNVAYTQEYVNYKNQKINEAYRPEKKSNEKVYEENGFQRVIAEYKSDLSYCSHNQVYETGNKLVHEYFSIYSHPFFCTHFVHTNGRAYLVYKQDLYGYSMFDIASKETFRYIPALSFQYGETFIATDIFCNPLNDVIAAEGCYWAGPSDTFVFEIKEPLKRFGRHQNLHLLIDEEYEKYDDVCFEGWNDTTICLKCSYVEEEPYHDEYIQILQSQYFQ